MSRSVKQDYESLRRPASTTSPAKLLAMTPRKAARDAYLTAFAVELDARRAFHLEPTPENLTAWADARNELEERKAKL